MVIPRVSFEPPPGCRACGQGPNGWEYARASGGSTPFLGDIDRLRRRFPSRESEALYLEHVRAGTMHVRLYYAEPRALPGILLALRLHTKRPGPLGLQEQTRHALDAGDLLLASSERNFR